MEYKNPFHLTDRDIQTIRASQHPLVYSKEEEALVREHIEAYFGTWSYELEEVVSPDIQVNLLAVPPDKKHACWTIVTLGMGAYKMNVPEEYRHEDQPRRCEILMMLPAGWDIFSDRKEWYWPLYVIKRLARFPISRDTWFEAGHFLEDEKPYTPDLSYRTTILYPPWTIPEKGRRLILPSGETLAFYQAIPIYDDEMNLRDAIGSDPFYKLMKKELKTPVLQVRRNHIQMK